MSFVNQLNSESSNEPMYAHTAGHSTSHSALHSAGHSSPALTPLSTANSAYDSPVPSPSAYNPENGRPPGPPTSTGQPMVTGQSLTTNQSMTTNQSTPGILHSLTARPPAMPNYANNSSGPNAGKTTKPQRIRRPMNVSRTKYLSNEPLSNNSFAQVPSYALH